MNPYLVATLGHVDPAVLGRRIRETRRVKGLTQSQVVDGVVSAAYLSRIEGGDRRPSVKLLELIAERLSTTAEHLLTGVAASHAEQLRLAVRYAELCLESGEVTEAERASAELIDDPEIDTVGDVRADAAYVHARALEVRGLLDQAAVELERFRQRESSSSARWPDAMLALSRCYREAGDLNRAIDIAGEALAELHGQGLDALDEAVQLELALCAAYFERGDELYAATRCSEAVARAEKLGSPEARAAAYWNASVIESHRGNLARSLLLAERALKLLEDGGDARNIGRLRLQLGIILLRAEEPDLRRAERQLRKARKELAASSGSAIDIARCDVQLATARLSQGDLDTAASLAASVLDDIGKTAPLVAADAHIVLGQVAATRQAKAQIRSHYRAAAAALTAAVADRRVAETWSELAGLLEDAGDRDSAYQALRSALAAAGLPPRLHQSAAGTTGPARRLHTADSAG